MSAKQEDEGKKKNKIKHTQHKNDNWFVCVKCLKGSFTVLLNYNACGVLNVRPDCVFSFFFSTHILNFVRACHVVNAGAQIDTFRAQKCRDSNVVAADAPVVVWFVFFCTGVMHKRQQDKAEINPTNKTP